ncbi:MAG: hypothetical protein K2N38_07985 [Oscillospiraceae bacterium]|nr:hypothetical protein [Oscillospiraceae bacterium]
MTAESIFEGVSYIDDALIERSGGVLKRRRFAAAVRTVAGVAAALVLAFGGLLAYRAVILSKTGTDSPVSPIITAQLDGADYEFVKKGSEFLKEHGLSVPTEELKSAYIGGCYVEFYGYHDMPDGEFEFYELNGCPNRDIIIGDRGGRRSYWAMMCIDLPGGTVSERLAHKGYYSAEDVHSLRVYGKKVRGREKTNEIWNALQNGTEIDGNRYDALIKGDGYDEANAQEVYTRHADSAVEIVFNYGELNCLRLTYYTDIGCFSGIGYILGEVTF